MNKAGYSFIEKSPFTFEFYTSFGAAYSVIFSSAKPYFKSNSPVQDLLYSVDITLLHPGPYNHYDYVVGITVAEIILLFFSSDERRIIFYICDPIDGRMQARIRKFHYWFLLFNNGDFKKLDVTISMRSFNMNLVFLFLKTNTVAYDLPIIIEEAKDRF